MSALDRAVIAGVYEHPTRWAPDKTQFQICAESARGALADAGLTIADVDGFLTAGVGPIGIMTLAEHLNLEAALPRRHQHRRLVVRRPRPARRGRDRRRALRDWR